MKFPKKYTYKCEQTPIKIEFSQNSTGRIDHLIISSEGSIGFHNVQYSELVRAINKAKKEFSNQGI